MKAAVVHLFVLLLIASTSALAVAASSPDNIPADETPQVTLPPLPYSVAALRPALSQETLQLHYFAHQQGYVTALQTWFQNNAAAAKKLFAGYRDAVRAAEILSVQQAAARQIGDPANMPAAGSGSDILLVNSSFVTYLAKNMKALLLEDRALYAPIRNHVGQILNHALYFQLLTAEAIPLAQFADVASTDPFVAALRKAFGGVDEFLATLKKRCLAHFASGWVYVVVNGRTRQIELLDAHDAETHFDTAAGDDAPQPLFVVDVWEHAYYVDRRNRRAEYVDELMKVIDWRRVAKRYALLVAGAAEGVPVSLEVRAAALTEEERVERGLTAAVSPAEAYPQFV